MRKLIPLLTLLVATSANAQMYKCIKDGKTTYQGSPCDSRSTASKASANVVRANAKWPWEGLKFGMSVEEVQRNSPGARQVAGSHLSSGAKALLNKPGVMVAGIAFEATYYFRDGKFAQVNVDDPAMNANEVTLRNFDKLLSELRVAYGQEEERKINKESWGVSGEARWSVGGDKLWVSISPITADTSRLNFGYNQAR